MRLPISLALASFALLGGALLSLDSADAQASSPGVMRGVDCATVAGTSSYRAGHTHTVIVRNGCDHAISCEVSTSVDPSPTHHLDVGAGQSGSVVTRIGSPASEFRAMATCAAAP